MGRRQTPPHPRAGVLDDTVNVHQGADTTADATIGISLSGGGYRATLFALGALAAVYDAGLWANIRWIASVSGGSFANAAAASSLPIAPSADQFDDLLRRSVGAAARAGSLAGAPRNWRRAGLVGAAYEAGIERSWLANRGATLRSLQRDDRLHAFLAVDLATLKPAFVTDRIVHSVGLEGEPHVAQDPGSLSLASAVRASASFPGLPAVRVTPADLGESFLDPMENDLLLGDGGAWNNLATNWERVAGWLNRRLVPVPSAIPAEVDLHIVVDASAPPRRSALGRSGRRMLALDRPILSFGRSFKASLHSTLEAHHLALRNPDFSMPARVAVVSIDAIPTDLDPRFPITRGAPKEDWVRVSEHNRNIGLARVAALGLPRKSAIHLLAHAYGNTASHLATRGSPYARFGVPHERMLPVVV